jgi:hypothetical protein
MQPEQDDHTKDHRGQQNLYDVIVEDLLVGVRRVDDRWLLGLVGLKVRGDNGANGAGGVLDYLHVHYSLTKHREFPEFDVLFLGSSPIFRGPMFITKVPHPAQLNFANICRLLNKRFVGVGIRFGGELNTVWGIPFL